jgi:hypothetical protein
MSHKTVTRFSSRAPSNPQGHQQACGCAHARYRPPTTAYDRDSIVYTLAMHLRTSLHPFTPTVHSPTFTHATRPCTGQNNTRQTSIMSVNGDPDREPLVSGARFDPYTGKKLDSVRPTYTHASHTHAHTPDPPCPPTVCMQYHSTRFISNCIHTPAKQARPAHALRNH